MRPVTIRGGFTGVEATCAERADEAVSILDGGHETSPLMIANTADVTVERVVFANGKGLGVDKSGVANLTLVDCRIEGNGWSLGYSVGYGAKFEGSASATQEKVLFFNLSEQAWAPSSTFITCADIKAYDISTDGKQILATIPKPGLNPDRSWVTNELDLYRDGVMKLFRLLPGAEFYKARWIP